MNVDTQFPQVPLVTLPSRAPHTRPDQASARPVDRPHHDEPADNRGKQGADQAEAHDRAVGAHESAHKTAAGSLARGGAQFEFETGPDGRRYAVGGEISIDTSKVPGDPQATPSKAETVQRAATAPALPSNQDRTVAAQAGGMEAEARQELAAEEHDSEETEASGPRTPSTDTRFSQTSEPAQIGELIDVLV